MQCKNDNLDDGDDNDDYDDDSDDDYDDDNNESLSMMMSMNLGGDVKQTLSHISSWADRQNNQKVFLPNLSSFLFGPDLEKDSSRSHFP